MILAEVNTHRQLSRNSASSRAIPVAKSIQAIRDDPFIPEEFGKNKPGMKWDESLGTDEAFLARQAWISAKEAAIFFASQLERQGVHKGLANRVLEPYKWHTAIISATEWSNFFALRTDENAQPEFRKIALMMQELYKTNKPGLIEYGEWHLPLVTHEEIIRREEDKLFREAQAVALPPWESNKDYWKKVSVGRCARVSYLTHDGIRDPQKDIELHDLLLTNSHLSPFEHVATPLAQYMSGNFYGWHQYRKQIPGENDFSLIGK
jgi:hypothetical protein